MNSAMLANDMIVQGQPAVPVQGTLGDGSAGKDLGYPWASPVGETAAKLLCKTPALTGCGRSVSSLW